MKKRVLAFIFCIIFLNLPAFSGDIDSDMMDFDYNFLDNAFSNPNPVTNKQFEDLMSKYENKKKSGLIYKIKKFFNSNNPMYDENFKVKYENPNNRPNRIKDKPEEKTFVTIGFNFTDSTGKVLSAGHYQVEPQKTENGYVINLIQGNSKKALIRAKETVDDWETPAVIYSRAVIISKDIIKIVYSNLDLTISGYIRATDEDID